LKNGLKGRADLVKSTGAIYQWNLQTSNGLKHFTIDLKNGDGDVHEGAAKSADCTLTLSEADFISLTEGKLNSQQAFMAGKLKIAGNMSLAIKLGKVLEEARKGASTSPAPSSSPAPFSNAAPTPSSNAAPAPAAKSDFDSDVVFQEMSSRLKDDPSVVKDVNAVIHWVLSKAGNTKTWTSDLKNAPGFVKEGEHGKADVVISISDSDYIDLVSGKLNPQQAFMGGKLKLKGNMAIAMKLDKVIGKKKANL